MRIAWIHVTWFAVAACHDEPLPDLPPIHREVSGRLTSVSFDEQHARSIAPVDLAGVRVSAQIPVDDGWDVHAGTTDRDGTFEVPDVPLGHYWLDLPDADTGTRQLLWTDAAQLVFEQPGVGRGDAMRARVGTRLTLGPLDGLDPAGPHDALEVTSINAGLVSTLRVFTAGATTLETSFAWTNKALISAARSDRLLLAQLHEARDAATGITYLSPSKSATFDAIEQRDGEDTRVTGTFATPPELAYDLRWKRSGLAAVGAAVHPGGGRGIAGESFGLRAMPGGTAHGTLPTAPIVLAIDDAFFGTGEADLDERFAIANPYPESWLFEEAAVSFDVALAVPGTTSSIDVTAVVQVRREALGGGPALEPLVTPPQAPAIDGEDGFADRAGVGPTPVISWAAPALGTPTAYVIDVQQWDTSPGRSALATIARLIVPGDVTGVRMPSQVLAAGERYVLRIAAISQHEQDVRTHSLYAQALPFGSAEIVTGTISP